MRVEEGLREVNSADRGENAIPSNPLAFRPDVPVRRRGGIEVAGIARCRPEHHPGTPAIADLGTSPQTLLSMESSDGRP